MRILFLLSRFPYPLEKGDKLRAFNQIKRISKKHEIILYAISDRDICKEDLEAVSPYCEHIEIFRMSKFDIVKNILRALFSDLPFQSSYFFNHLAKNHLTRLTTQKKPERVFCQLIRMAPYINFIKGIPCILDYMDVFSVGLQRRMNKTNFLFRWIFNIESNRIKKYEANIKNEFAACTIISEQDRELLKNPDKNEVVIISNGVDFDHFSPSGSEKKFDLLFTGNMNYPPNIEAVLFICKKILPLIRIHKPEISFCIAGTNTAREITKLSTKHIVVTGWVQDIRPYYNASKIFIAPMQTGSGLQNKLLEAMAMKIPCVTSTLANNAINAIDTETVLIANTPEEFTKQILYLLNNPEKAKIIGNAGFEFVKKNFDWDIIVGNLEKLISSQDLTPAPLSTLRR